MFSSVFCTNKSVHKKVPVEHTVKPLVQKTSNIHMRYSPMVAKRNK